MKSSTRINNGAKRQALQLIVLQGLIALSISIANGLFISKIAAYAGLLGGLICVLPNMCFVLVAFKHAGARAAKQIVGSFYWAEAIKLGLTAALFAGSFYWGSLQGNEFPALPLLIGYISAQCGFWLAPLVFRARVFKKVEVKV